MSEPGDRLDDLLAHRPLTVRLEAGLERRAHLYADRLNPAPRREGDTDPITQTWTTSSRTS
jgi:hypothetical protein